VRAAPWTGTDTDDMDPRIEARLKPGTDYHPMQLIPLFRRWKPSTLRNMLLTVILSIVIASVIGLAILMFGGQLTGKRFASIMIYTLAIAFTQHYLYQFSIRVARKSERLAVILMHPLALAVALPIVGIYIGSTIAIWILSDYRVLNLSQNWRDFLLASMIAVAIGWVLWESVESNRKREVERRERAELAAAIERSERERATAELKTLRAQVEPHFLYNTLSNVVSLIEREPATAKHMTERLIGYLRHTLDASRRDHATVGDELAIVADYLEILRLRMGERLSYSVAADDATRALPLSPMLLQPLVENSIKHGLEPKIEGGHVNVTAHVEDGVLQIAVEDSGLGFGVATDTAGSGSGLANVRGRLKAIYGDDARVAIEQPAVGTRIRLSIPLAA